VAAKNFFSYTRIVWVGVRVDVIVWVGVMVWVDEIVK
jgi:hypothetical protein